MKQPIIRLVFLVVPPDFHRGVYFSHANPVFNVVLLIKNYL